MAMWSRTKSQKHTARSWVWLCHALNGSHYGSQLSQVVENMAERVGFEPTLEFPLNTLSKRAPSATRPSLRHFCPERIRHALGKKEATAVGRSTERVCLSILWGRDGGRNWKQIAIGIWHLAFGTKTKYQVPTAKCRLLLGRLIRLSWFYCRFFFALG